MTHTKEKRKPFRFSPRVGNGSQNCLDHILFVIPDVLQESGDVVVVQREALFDQVSVSTCVSQPLHTFIVTMGRCERRMMAAKQNVAPRKITTRTGHVLRMASDYRFLPSQDKSWCPPRNGKETPTSFTRPVEPKPDIGRFPRSSGHSYRNLWAGVWYVNHTMTLVWLPCPTSVMATQPAERGK